MVNRSRAEHSRLQRKFVPRPVQHRSPLNSFDKARGLV